MSERGRRLPEATSRQQLIDDILGLDRRLLQLARNVRPSGWFELDLTMAQLKVLFYLFTADATSMSELARTLGVALPSVTSVVDRLVERGLVGRRQDPADRRMVLAELTEEGSTLADRLHRNGRILWEDILGRLSDEELCLVASAMTAVHRAAASLADATGGPKHRSCVGTPCQPDQGNAVEA